MEELEPQRGELLTTSDAARVLQVSADLVRQLARAGRLPALITRSGQRLFWEKDVENLVRVRAAKHEHGDAADQVAAPAQAVPA
jgi:excisionase family DNA binding protein